MRTSHIKTALQYLDGTEKTMSKSFAYVGVTSEARVAQLIIDFIGSRGGRVTHVGLMRYIRKYIRSRKELMGILDTLYGSQIIEAEYDKNKVSCALKFTAAYVKEKSKEQAEIFDGVKVRQTNS